MSPSETARRARVKKNTVAGLFFLSLVSFFACDPIAHYVPKHLEGSERTGFMVKLEGAAVSLPTLTPLLAHNFYLMSLTIENTGDKPIDLVEAQFIGKQKLSAQIHSASETIDPKAKTEILLSWEIDEGSFANALGEEPTLILVFQSGDDELISKVVYQKRVP